jgi:hypothetical protein
MLWDEVERMREDDRRRLAEREVEGGRTRDEERDWMRREEERQAYLADMREQFRREEFERMKAEYDGLACVPFDDATDYPFTSDYRRMSGEMGVFTDSTLVTVISRG